MLQLCPFALQGQPAGFANTFSHYHANYSFSFTVRSHLSHHVLDHLGIFATPRVYHTVNLGSVNCVRLSERPHVCNVNQFGKSHTEIATLLHSFGRSIILCRPLLCVNAVVAFLIYYMIWRVIPWCCAFKSLYSKYLSSLLCKNKIIKSTKAIYTFVSWCYILLVNSLHTRNLIKTHWFTL